MRKNGQIIDSAKFDMIGELTNDRAIVLKRGKIGYINSGGKIVLETKYEEFPNYLEIGKFNGAYAVVRVKGKFGVIDKTGKLIVPATYLQLGNYSTLMAFNKGKGWGYTDLLGIPVILPQFDHAESFKNGSGFVEKAGLVGVIDSKGTPIIPIEFDQIEPLDSESVIVAKNGRFGVYTMTGKEIIPTEYEQIRILNKDFLLLTIGAETHYLYRPLNKIIKPKLGDE